VAVAGGFAHSLGLKSNGTVVAWGNDEYGQCDVPPPNAGFAAIAAGAWFSLGLKSDGTVVAWGLNSSGQCNVPAPNAGFVAIAAGKVHSLGLKSDGTIVAWGNSADGQCGIPVPNADFVAVAGGEFHSLGLKSDGVIVAWGNNDNGQCVVPSPNVDYLAVAGGQLQSVGVRRLTAVSVEDPPRSDAAPRDWLVLGATAPNPFTASIRVSFDVEEPAPVSLQVFDVGGRLVRSLDLGVLRPAQHQAEWDGRDEHGNPVAAGVYMMRLGSAAAQSRAVPVVMAK
jgi:hypothetical protein